MEVVTLADIAAVARVGARGSTSRDARRRTAMSSTPSMSKPLFALRKGDVMATVLQWLKQENFHMPAAMLASAASDQKLEVPAPERVPPAHLEALLQLANVDLDGADARHELTDGAFGARDTLRVV